jgi:hypothetical protein
MKKELETKDYTVGLKTLCEAKLADEGVARQKAEIELLVAKWNTAKAEASKKINAWLEYAAKTAEKYGVAQDKIDWYAGTVEVPEEAPAEAPAEAVAA